MPQRRDDDVELAQTLAEVARTLVDESDVEATLRRICQLAVKTVESCQAAGLSVVEDRRITSRSTTDDLPRVVDEIQSQTGEGPCIDAIVDHEVFVTGSLATERRWPRFAPQAHERTGVESILGVRLFTTGKTMGALDFYSEEPDAFDDHDVAVASVFAAHAAVALANAKREEDLENKAATRDAIGMAKGIIMGRQHVSDDEAFEILRRASQRMNLKLREVAKRLVDQRLAEEVPGAGSSAQLAADVVQQLPPELDELGR